MEDRASLLRDMKICRFCITDNEPLRNIYNKDKNNAVPLPLQIMACVALEVFQNDGMPQLICDNCITQTQQSYIFKSVCKRSDDALKLFLATGVLKRGNTEISVSTSSGKHAQAKEKNENPPKRRKINDKITKTEQKEALNQSQSSKISKKEIVQIITEDEPTEIIIETQSQDEEKNIDTTQNIELQLEENMVINNEEQIIVVNQAIQNEDIIANIRIGNENEEDGTLLFEEPHEEVMMSTPKVVKTQVFACNYCERSFPLQQLLEMHERNHTRERKFGCKQCDKRFFSKHDLNKHCLTHMASKPFSCVVCDKAFSRITLLHRHEKIHIGSPKYLCTYCDKTFLTSESLDVHMKDHKKNRPFQCTKCEKKFAFKQGLERHEVSHLNENAFKCNYCPESFSTNTKLQRHVTSHAGNRPFPCKMCPRTFVLSHHLTRHMKGHYTSKKQEVNGDFKCEVCSMSFRKKYLLINHSAIHSMVNLKCVICKREFEDAQTVKEHITTHYGGFPFECNRCEYSFETESDYLAHSQKHDEESLEEEINPESTPRRSLRAKRTKNFTDFLKPEDINDEIIDSDEEFLENEVISDNSENDEDFIKETKFQPVMRNDSLKTYKPSHDKVKNSPTPENEPQKPSKFLKITTVENLGISQTTLDNMNLDQSNFVEMKIGQKTIRVQKLMMTKAEVEALSEQGKLDLQGCKLLVNNPQGIDLNNLTKIASQVALSEEGVSSSKSVRTYTKKVQKKEDIETEEQKTEVQESTEQILENAVNKRSTN